MTTWLLSWHPNGRLGCTYVFTSASLIGHWGQVLLSSSRQTSSGQRRVASTANWTRFSMAVDGLKLPHRFHGRPHHSQISLQAKSDNRGLNTLPAPHILLQTDPRGMSAPSAAVDATIAAEVHSAQEVHVSLAPRQHAARSSVKHRGGFPFARKFPLSFRVDRRVDIDRMAGGSSVTTWS